jgi:hypothetical protein
MEEQVEPEVLNSAEGISKTLKFIIQDSDMQGLGIVIVDRGKPGQYARSYAASYARPEHYVLAMSTLWNELATFYTKEAEANVEIPHDKAQALINFGDGMRQLLAQYANEVKEEKTKEGWG